MIAKVRRGRAPPCCAPLETGGDAVPEEMFMCWLSAARRRFALAVSD
jgi:hypothetical protein